MNKLILIIKTILALAIISVGTISIGWFIGTIITLKMECGG